VISCPKFLLTQVFDEQLVKIETAIGCSFHQRQLATTLLFFIKAFYLFLQLEKWWL
jgi:hypothetical protein